MKLVSLLQAMAILLAVSGNTFGKPDKQALTISQLTGDYYVYTTWKPYEGNPFPSNSMYLVTTAGVVLFDTPWDTTQFQPLLDSIENRHHKKVVLCIATHYHADRTAGLEYYAARGIATFSSRQTFDLCREHGEKQAAGYFTKDTTFTCGNHAFETFYAGDGHTKDNIVIWCGDTKVLYGGCLIKNVESKGLGNIADANLSQWPRTIKKVMKKYRHAKYVIPGHMAWGNKELLKHTRKLLKNDRKNKKQLTRELHKHSKRY